MLALRLGLVPELEVIGHAGNGLEAVAAARLLSPDLMTLDLRMPLMGGAEAIPLLRSAAPRMRIITFTSALDGQGLFGASRPDATVLKSNHLDRLVEAILETLRPRHPAIRVPAP